MKRLLLWILLAGSVMGQDTVLMKNGIQHEARLIEIRENSAVVEVKGVGLGAEFIVQEVPLRLIDRIILEDGTVVWTANVLDSESEGVTAPKDSSRLAAIKYYSRPQGNQDVLKSIDTESKSAAFTVHNLGILMIAGSGVLGYINNNKECDPCNDIDDVEDFADDLKSRANLQYGSLFLGAILMLVGEDMNLVVPATE